MSIPTITIPLSDYRRLREAYSLIEALEAVGVDFWPGFADALKLHKEWLKATQEEVSGG